MVHRVTTTDNEMYGTTSDNEWQRVITNDSELQWVTTNDSEWQWIITNNNEWRQQMTTSGTTNENESEQVKYSHFIGFKIK